MNVSCALRGVLVHTPNEHGFLSTREDREMHLELLKEFILIKNTLWSCSEGGMIDLQLFFCALREMATPFFMRADPSSVVDRSAAMVKHIADDDNV